MEMEYGADVSKETQAKVTQTKRFMLDYYKSLNSYLVLLPSSFTSFLLLKRKKLKCN
jgi:hypothetical protein